MGKWTQIFCALGPRESKCFNKLLQTSSGFVKGNKVDQATPTIFNILVTSDGKKTSTISLEASDSQLKSVDDALLNDRGLDSSLCSNAPGLGLEKFPSVEALLDKPSPQTHSEMLRFSNFNHSFMDIGRLPIIACPGHQNFSKEDNSQEQSKLQAGEEKIPSEVTENNYLPKSLKLFGASLCAFANKNYPLEWQNLTKTTALVFANSCGKKEKDNPCYVEPPNPCKPKVHDPCAGKKRSQCDGCLVSKSRPVGPQSCPPCPPGCSADCVVKIPKPKPKLVCVCKTHMPRTGPSPIEIALKLVFALALLYLLFAGGLFGSPDDTRSFFDNIKAMIEEWTGKAEEAAEDAKKKGKK